MSFRLQIVKHVAILTPSERPAGVSERNNETEISEFLIKFIN
jgi:hypothetical protein